MITGRTQMEMGGKDEASDLECRLVRRL